MAAFVIDGALYASGDVFHDRVESLAPRNVAEKLVRVLDYLKLKTGHPGQRVDIHHEMDYPIAFCQNGEELQYLLDHLRGMEFVGGEAGIGEELAVLTPKGWAYLEAQAGANRDSRQAFVAMSFKPEFAPIFAQGIEPAESETGFKMVRVDSEEHNEKIDDRIMVLIRRSRFLVADVTVPSPGVYFEAGYALGMHLPVIWTCQADQQDDCHFDTRQFNHIFWKNTDELREKLTRRILVTIGKAKPEVGG